MAGHGLVQHRNDCLTGGHKMLIIETCQVSFHMWLEIPATSLNTFEFWSVLEKTTPCHQESEL